MKIIKNAKTHMCFFFVFAPNAKKGSPKKQTGRPKNSEKALSKY